MNARQKAKKYKKELELLKKQTVKQFYIEQDSRQVKSFTSLHTFSVSPISVPENDKKRILLKQLINNEDFLDSVKLERSLTERPGSYPDQVTYYIQLDVVRR